MGKTKKAGKAGKATKAVKKNGKNDKSKRGKVKYVDPTSSVSREVRATVEAIAESIERDDDTETAAQKAARRQAKAEAKRKKVAAQVGIEVKTGMTKKQANNMAQRMNAQRPLENIPDPNYEGDEEDDNGTEEDFSDTANERAKEYCKGGYHPVVVGELYHERYRIVKKLGWGYFSTVWLVWDYQEERYQAMKIQKSAKHYREAAYDEIKLLTEIMEADPKKTRYCARLNDFFEHTGPNGTHVCMVFDVYGENLLSLMERYEYRGIPLPIVKCIARQVLVALEHIASINIIHTDLKPENVLLSTPKHGIISLMKHYHVPPLHQRPKLTERDPKTMTKSQRRRYYKKLAKDRELERNGHLPGEDDDDDDDDDDHSSASSDHSSSGDDDDSEASKTDPEWEVERFHHVILADFGNSCWTNKQFTDEVQTRQYRSPEVILGETYSTPIDIWSFACMIFELITGEFLFDPKKGDNYSRDEDHLARMQELLGDLPESMRLGEGKYLRYYYNSKGELRNIQEMHYWGLVEVLHERHRFTREKATEIAEFLLPMLEYLPEERATPTDMLRDFDSFFDIKEDDYEPLCFVERNDDDDDGKDEEHGDDDDEENEEDMESYSSSASSVSQRRGLNRSRQADLTDGERIEAFRFWEEHPILNRSALEDRGLTIADIQAVLSGKVLETPGAQEAATEVILMLSEEDRMSTGDGHEADVEDVDVDDDDDEQFETEDDDDSYSQDSAALGEIDDADVDAERGGNSQEGDDEPEDDGVEEADPSSEGQEQEEEADDDEQSAQTPTGDAEKPTATVA